MPTCVGWNPLQPHSPSFLTSPVPPTIANDLTDVVVTRLSPAVLTCYASGVPPPTVSWSKEGAQLGSRGGGYRVLPTGTSAGSCSPSGVVGPGQPSHCLPSACCLPRGPGDLASAACPRWPLHLHGEECCWHSPETPPACGAWYVQLPGVLLPVPWPLVGEPWWVGNTSLPLAEPPALKPLPGMVMVMVNTSAVLSCEATGVPRPELMWRKDGVGISGGEREPAGGWQSLLCPGSLCLGGDVGVPGVVSSTVCGSSRPPAAVQGGCSSCCSHSSETLQEGALLRGKQSLRAVHPCPGMAVLPCPALYSCPPLQGLG